jgi:nitrate/TMAO reductase-like tetraheme cytochrome c subunit
MKWRGSKVWVGLWGIVSLFLFLWLTPEIVWSDSSFCLDCHKDETLVKKDARGKSISLSVSEAGFKNSVHGKLSCSDCHTRIKDDKHVEGGKAVDKSVNCGVCHKEADKEYQQGLHSKMIMKGTERAANCYECHGKHNILPSKNPKSLTHVSNIERTCNRCHSDVEFVKHHALGAAIPRDEFKRSVHGKTGEVTCISCHGSHNLRSLIDPKSSIFRSNVPQTCGACHPDITKQFIESIHGVFAARGRSDSPTCTTCHGFHGIKAKIDPDSPVNERRIARTTCPQCHAAERISKEYKLTTLQVKSYYDSFHGLSYRGGDTYSANCASCHGVHDIRSSSDPQSMIHKDNLQKTCGSCHPGASENFAKGKMHSVVSISGEEFGEKVVGWVRVVYIILIVIVIGGMVFFNFTDWLRKTIDHRP